VRRIRPREATGIDRARQILAERYAGGEITTDEYRERLDQLR
jgi:putative membrane protein